MENANLKNIVENLKEIQLKKGDLQKSVDHFLKTVWNGEDEITGDSDIDDILTDLAHMLEYYVEDERKRNQDSTYFGNDRLKLEINEALVKIENLRLKK